MRGPAPAALARTLHECLAPLGVHARRSGLTERQFATLATAAFRGERPRAAAESGLPYPVALRVVGRWLTDPAYSRRGRPRVLPLTGTASFAALVRAAAAGAPAAALAALRARGVVRTARNRVRLLRAGYIPTRDDAAKADSAGRAASEFLGLVLHNLTAPPGRGFLQRAASYDNIGASSLATLRTRLRADGERLLGQANRMLASRDRDRNPGAGKGRRARVSFGVYYYEAPVSRAPRTRR